MTFFVEWQIEGCEPLIEERETRDEMHKRLEFLKLGEAKIIGIWAGDEWYLHDDGKIYCISTLGKKKEDKGQKHRETPGC